LTDERTIGQLAGILYEIDSQGRLRIESKEQARARGFLSPDRAEALMLALCKPPQKFEYFSVRDLPQLRSDWGTSKVDGVFADDDENAPRLRRSRFEAFAPGSLAAYFRKRGGGW
jgi:hypothetical protein